MPGRLLLGPKENGVVAGVATLPPKPPSVPKLVLAPLFYTRHNRVLHKCCITCSGCTHFRPGWGGKPRIYGGAAPFLSGIFSISPNPALQAQSALPVRCPTWTGADPNFVCRCCFWNEKAKCSQWCPRPVSNSRFRFEGAETMARCSVSTATSFQNSTVWTVLPSELVDIR